MELAKLLGRRAPYSFMDMLFVYFTRDVPFATALLGLAFLFARDQLPNMDDVLSRFDSVGFFAFAVIIVSPLIETLFFLFFILVVPQVWYRSSSNLLSANARQITLCVFFGTMFGLLHLADSVFAAISAAIGGMIMFAVLLQHWLCGSRDRGIVMCWALHSVHNLLLVSIFILVER